MLVRAHIFFFCSGHQAPSGLAGCQISRDTGWWSGLMSCPSQKTASEAQCPITDLTHHQSFFLQGAVRGPWRLVKETLGVGELPSDLYIRSWKPALMSSNCSSEEKNLGGRHCGSQEVGSYLYPRHWGGWDKRVTTLLRPAWATHETKSQTQKNKSVRKRMARWFS